MIGVDEKTLRRALAHGPLVQEGDTVVFAALRRLIRHEAARGLVLLAGAVLALILANSALAGFYNSFVEVLVILQVGMLKLSKHLLLWINDGLMAILFLLISFEVKREFLEGKSC